MKTMNNGLNLISPQWPVSKTKILSFNTTRQGGFSQSPYASLNLGDHVFDAREAVIQNRKHIANQCKFTREPLWLNQTHSSIVIDSEQHHPGIEADAIISRTPSQPLVIMTADCLPILLCNQQATEIAAIHAGWKSLSNGIIRHTLERMHSSPQDIIAWLGPCISQTHFEVGLEVRDAFAAIDNNFQAGFAPHPDPNKTKACLHTLASNQFKTLGVSKIYRSDLCTYQNQELFFSYRREKITGRMGAFISILN